MIKTAYSITIKFLKYLDLFIETIAAPSLYICAFVAGGSGNYTLAFLIGLLYIAIRAFEIMKQAVDNKKEIQKLAKTQRALLAKINTEFLRSRV